MLEQRRRILNMLAEGKISAADADGLLAAMDDTRTPPPVTEVKPAAPKSPRYLRVQVEEYDGDNSKVNIRVPFNLIGCGRVTHGAVAASGLHETDQQGTQRDRSGLRHQQGESGEPGSSRSSTSRSSPSAWMAGRAGRSAFTASNALAIAHHHPPFLNALVMRP